MAYFPVSFDCRKERTSRNLSILFFESSHGIFFKNVSSSPVLKNSGCLKCHSVHLGVPWKLCQMKKEIVGGKKCKA